MKKYLLVWVLLAAGLGSCTAGYVTTRPADVHYARSLAPGPGYVWINGDWVWSGGNYHWKEGYWHEARPGRSWKSGYWEKSHQGYRWHKGYWQ
jgi:WXXGXW repeat (2 copies)